MRTVFLCFFINSKEKIKKSKQDIFNFLTPKNLFFSKKKCTFAVCIKKENYGSSS